MNNNYSKFLRYSAPEAIVFEVELSLDILNTSTIKNGSDISSVHRDFYVFDSLEGNI